ncbi:MAG: alpha/beta fold hydrolase [Deltaproteobacteria bacterium]|nr:alpha/beta fold hydrolase [Deltaproteobacteria bacterium]
MLNDVAGHARSIAGTWFGFWSRELLRASTYLEHAFPTTTPEPRWATPAETSRLRDTVHLRLPAPGEGGGLPILVVTPQVNHSYVADFAPDQSLVRTLLAAGAGRIAVTDWQPPPRRPYRIADSIDDIVACIDALGGRVHLAGLCQGGWQCAIAAALHPDKVATLTLAAAPVDAHAGRTKLHDFVHGLPMAFYENLVRTNGGVAPGAALATGFDLLRPEERFWRNYRDLWLNALDPGYVARYDRIRNWYRLNKDVAGDLYVEVVRDIFKGNRLANGTLRVGGRVVDLARIRCPAFLIAGAQDHITPPEQVFAFERLAPHARCRRFTARAGHVGVFMGHTALRSVWPEVAAGMLAAE